MRDCLEFSFLSQIGYCLEHRARQTPHIHIDNLLLAAARHIDVNDTYGRFGTAVTLVKLGEADFVAGFKQNKNHSCEYGEAAMDKISAALTLMTRAVDIDSRYAVMVSPHDVWGRIKTVYGMIGPGSYLCKQTTHRCATARLNLRSLLKKAAPHLEDMKEYQLATQLAGRLELK